MTLDHLLACELGGQNTAANLVTCCVSCNRKWFGLNGVLPATNAPNSAFTESIVLTVVPGLYCTIN